MQSVDIAQILFQEELLSSMSYFKWEQKIILYSFKDCEGKKREKPSKISETDVTSSNCFVCSLIFYLCGSVPSSHHPLIKKVKAEGPVHYDP